MNSPSLDPPINSARAYSSQSSGFIRGAHPHIRCTRGAPNVDRLLPPADDEDVTPLDRDLGGLRPLPGRHFELGRSLPADARAEADLKVMLRFAAEPSRGVVKLTQNLPHVHR